VLFVGTKRQAQAVVAECARGEHALRRRALAGRHVTNFETVRTRLSRLVELRRSRRTCRPPEQEGDGRPHARAQDLPELDGIRNMERIPGALTGPEEGAERRRRPGSLASPSSPSSTRTRSHRDRHPDSGQRRFDAVGPALMTRLTDSITTGLTAYAVAGRG
jgi:hypothetical protein